MIPKLNCLNNIYNAPIFYIGKYHCDNVNCQEVYKYIWWSCLKCIKFLFWLQVSTSLGKSIYSQSLIVKTKYNKTELDKLREDMKEQIIDPGIKKLEASLTLIKSSVTSLSSSVAAAETSLTSTKATVTSLNSSVTVAVASLKSSMDTVKTKLENLKHQVKGGVLRTKSNIWDGYYSKISLLVEAVN